MDKSSSYQSSKYVFVSAVGAFFLTSLISNLLGGHFEAAIIFNWLCAVYLLRSAGPESYHYAVTIAIGLLVGGIIFAVSIAPLWLFTSVVGLIGDNQIHIKTIEPVYLLVINSIVSSVYMLIGFRRMGVDLAKDFM